MNITVIIPCYNHGNHLAESLQSVIAQKFAQWDCIIVNDGSTDDTEKIAQEFCATDNRFSYTWQANTGLASARNTGIAKANDGLILPLDSDDLLHEDYLSTCLKYVDDKTVVFTSTRLFGNDCNEIWNEEFSAEKLLCSNQIPCTALYHKKMWVTAGGYNENMKFGFEDWDFWLSLLERGIKFHKVNEPLFLYRQSENSMIKKLDDRKRKEMIEQIGMNHLQLFAKKFGDPMSLNFQLQELKRQLELYKNSTSLKIGKAITQPLKMMRKKL